MNDADKKIHGRLRDLEKENLRLKAELDIRKTGKATSSFLGNSMKSMTTRAIAGNRLKKSVSNLMDELPGNPSKETLSDVLTNLIMRVTRIGAFAILVAAAPMMIMAIQTYMLNRQNEKLTEQNHLIGRQNERLDQQINLEEGSRRSSLVFFMSNIMDRVDEELKSSPQRVLSDALIGRIVSLSQALRPYRYLENDELTSRQLSPERGQLLFSLINSNLNKETYDKIYERANFSYADLREANFSNSYMKRAKLANSFFYKANFSNANLEGADLSFAYLEDAHFKDTQMDGADLRNANLSKSHMEGITIKNGNLEMADLRKIYLEGDFRGCLLEGIIIQEATLANVDLRGSKFRSLEWLEKMRNYNLKGFASLVEYYEPEVLYEYKGLYIDTLYQLNLDEKSTKINQISCNQATKELVASASGVKQLKKQLEKTSQTWKLYLLKSPFAVSDLGIEQDSVYLFKLSPSKISIDTTDVLLKFDPVEKKLWEMERRGGIPAVLTEIGLSTEQLKGWETECHPVKTKE